MATFNGAAFLEQQLETLSAQTRAPCELVVSDDGSTDDTIAILERFARTALFEVQIVPNTGARGFAGNFLHAASLCRGSLVAWCDQDDVWSPVKLERCAA